MLGLQVRANKKAGQQRLSVKSMMLKTADCSLPSRPVSDCLRCGQGG